MAEYIDREALKEGLAELRIFITGLRAGKGMLTEFACQYRNSILKAIDEFPAADVAPVVRCKECRWWNHAGCAIRIVDDTDKPQANDFCSYGERKEDNATD